MVNEEHDFVHSTKYIVLNPIFQSFCSSKYQKLGRIQIRLTVLWVLSIESYTKMDLYFVINYKI